MVRKSPFLSMVPSFVIETVVTLGGCTAAIPFRRVLWRRRLGPPTIQEDKDESETQESETCWPRWCGSQSQLHRAPRQQESMLARPRFSLPCPRTEILARCAVLRLLPRICTG